MFSMLVKFKNGLSKKIPFISIDSNTHGLKAKAIDGEYVYIPLDYIHYIVFKDINNNKLYKKYFNAFCPQKNKGKYIDLKFYNDERIEGLAFGLGSNKLGIILLPLAKRFNSVALFIPNGAISEIYEIYSSLDRKSIARRFQDNSEHNEERASR